ncbi:MAG: DUF6894 family protein [Janthinobacterium lividum]
MPRFFFHRADGVFDPDEVGSELPDLASARIEAVRFAADSIRDQPMEVWQGHNFRVEVSDEEGMLLCTVVILGLDAPAARGLRKPRRPAE